MPQSEKIILYNTPDGTAGETIDPEALMEKLQSSSTEEVAECAFKIYKAIKETRRMATNAIRFGALSALSKRVNTLLKQRRREEML